MASSINNFAEGRAVAFSRKVNEADINVFADLTGDHSPNHMDEQFMKTTRYGKRIVHGALLVGFMSKASTLILEKYPFDDPAWTAVSLGYDRIRFIKPVFIDDELLVSYEVENFDNDQKRAYSDIEITNQRDELVCVAKHILKWVKY